MAAIALYLVDHGSSCEYLNNYGFTALDATTNFKLQGLLKERHRRARYAGVCGMLTSAFELSYSVFRIPSDDTGSMSSKFASHVVW